MPAIAAGRVGPDAMEPGMVYSDESCLARATDQQTLSHSNYADLPGLTINLSLARPAGVVQVAQVDFRKSSGFTSFGIKLICGGSTSSPMTRVVRFSGIWQNIVLVWFWPSLGAGAHTFKVQSTAGTIGNRQNAVMVMRI